MSGDRNTNPGCERFVLLSSKDGRRVFWLSAAIPFLLYSQWLALDFVFSDDYGLFEEAQRFPAMAAQFGRPFYTPIMLAMGAFARSHPDAIIALKFVHLCSVGLFIGLFGVFVARTCRSSWAGCAAATLAAASPAVQINAVWVNILPQWWLFAATVVAFIGLRTASTLKYDRAATAAVGIGLAVGLSMLLYQMPLFLLGGLLAVYLILSSDTLGRLIRLCSLAAISAVAAAALYGSYLGWAVSTGRLRSGRAAESLSLSTAELCNRLMETPLSYGTHWLNLWLDPPYAIHLVLVFISLGFLIDVIALPPPSMGRLDRLGRWMAAASITLAVLSIPAMLNDFQVAYRLFLPGMIGVVGLMVASALAMTRLLALVFPWGLIVARFAGVCVLIAVCWSASAAVIVGLALPQCAEVAYIRKEIDRQRHGALESVHLIPPENRPFWNDPIPRPNQCLYCLRMSTYHSWARRGIVRYALRHVDPNYQIRISVAETAPEGAVVVDMREYRAFTNVR